MFLKKKKKPTGTNSVTTCGLLVHKLVGATLCVLRIPIAHRDTLKRPELDVDEPSCAMLTSSSLCFHLRRLLGEDIIHPC